MNNRNVYTKQELLFCIGYDCMIQDDKGHKQKCNVHIDDVEGIVGHWIVIDIPSYKYNHIRNKPLMRLLLE
jgi:hypothetical protein